MSPGAATLPDDAHIGRVALRVSDLDATAAFYGDVVGLDRLVEDEERCVLGVGEEPLLVLLAAPDAPARRDDETGLYHTAIRVPDRAALADALDRLDSEWHLEGAADHLVSEALYTSDPEGNGVEVYRDRPRSEWRTTADGGVEMDTLPLDLSDLRSESEGRSRAPAETTVGHVHLEVSSVPDARAFYVDRLGFDVAFAFGASALFVAAGGYHHHVGLNTWGGRTRPASGRGLAWFEVVVPARSDVDAVRERLADGSREGWGGDPEADDGLELVDPDGIALRVVER